MLVNFSVVGYKGLNNDVYLNFEDIGKYTYGRYCISQGIKSKVFLFGKPNSGKSLLANAINDIRYLVCGINVAGVAHPGKKAIFSYTFLVNRSRVSYVYSRNDNGEVVSELLQWGKRVIFKVDKPDGVHDLFSINKYVFETVNTEAIMKSDMPCLAWLVRNYKNADDSLIGTLVREVSCHKYEDVASWYGLYMDGISIDREDLDEIRVLADYVGIEGFENISFPINRKTASKSVSFLTWYYDRVLNQREKLFGGTLILDNFDTMLPLDSVRKLIEQTEKMIWGTQIIFIMNNPDILSSDLGRPDCYYFVEHGNVHCFSSAMAGFVKKSSSCRSLYNALVDKYY